MGLLIVLLMLGGVAAYVMKPDERKRAAARALRPIEDYWFALQDERAKPDAFRDALHARTRVPFVTLTILILNVGIFLMGGAGDPQALVHWGASVAPQTTDGEWWRLATASFVHAGFIALFVDALGLFQPAALAERLLGHAAVGVVFMCGGIASTLIALSVDPLTVAAGTTGGVLAVYGLLGAAIVRGIVRRSPMAIPMRTLRLMAPPAGLFLLHALWIGELIAAAGLVPLALGFVFGLFLASEMDDGPARLDRVVMISVGTLVIAAGIAWPMRGIVDARPAIARVVASENETSGEYAAAIGQFKLGALRADAVAQLIERKIDPELKDTQGRIAALGAVPREQRPLVAAASQYLTLRRESWELRAKAMHRYNMRLLRDADDKERAALAAFEKLRSLGADSES